MAKAIKVFLSLAVLIMVALYFAGCSLLQSAAGGGDGESYFPHAEGNTWALNGSDGSSRVMTVEGTAVIGGATVQRFASSYRSASTGLPAIEVYYYRVDGSGVYFYGTAGDPFTAPIRMIVFPLEVGKTWNAITIGSSYSINGAVAAKESVTVPAGTFECYRIVLTTTSGTGTDTSVTWLGDNAGAVKTTNSSSTVETELAWKNF